MFACSLIRRHLIMKVALYFFFSSKTLSNDSSCQPPALNDTHDRCVSCIRHGSLQPHPFLSSTSSSRLIVDGRSLICSGFLKKSFTPEPQASFSQSLPESMTMGVRQRCLILRARCTSSKPLSPGTSLSIRSRF